MITTTRPMSVDHARALAMAYELQNLLHSLLERLGDARFDAALDLLEGVLDELDSLGPDHGEQSPHSLRLLVTEPHEYEAHRSGYCATRLASDDAMRRLARKPWKQP